jgi:oxygen-independent coproporphyrinogen-3 oxidase
MTNLPKPPSTPPSNPLAVYIHWPFCKSKCPYCDFNSHVREQVAQDQWRDALLAELRTQAAMIPGRTLRSIFFGGGTPSLMPPATAAALIEEVHALWPQEENIEITLEANPTSVEANTFSDFKAAGINRVSLGVQSLRDEQLKFLGRQHSATEALKAVEKAAGVFDRYTFDLIYARPHQTVQDWEAELTEALTYAGQHMSLYQLTIEENTAFHHAYAKGGFTLPSDEVSEQLYTLTESLLADKGMRAYEVSNYAVPGQESRHNLAYWLGDEYLGIGPGAHGRLNLDRSRCEPAGSRMEQGSGLLPSADGNTALIRHATQTLKSPERWLEAVQRDGHGLEIKQPVDRQQEAEERIMMGLRLTDGISYDGFAQRTGFVLEDYIHQGKRDFYIREGLLVDDPARLCATLKGRLVLTSLTAELLA